MSVYEQFHRIVKAAPHMPYQSMVAISLVFAIPFLLQKGLENYFTDYKRTLANFSKVGIIQDRIREKEKEWFFKVFYTFNTTNETYTIAEEKGFRNERMAREYVKNLKENKEELEIWYNTENPNDYRHDEINTFWLPYFFAIGLVFLPLAYFRWLFLKYYELEIDEK